MRVVLGCLVLLASPAAWAELPTRAELVSELQDTRSINNCNQSGNELLEALSLGARFDGGVDVVAQARDSVTACLARGERAAFYHAWQFLDVAVEARLHGHTDVADQIVGLIRPHLDRFPRQAFSIGAMQDIARALNAGYDHDADRLMSLFLENHSYDPMFTPPHDEIDRQRHAAFARNELRLAMILCDRFNSPDCGDRVLERYVDEVPGARHADLSWAPHSPEFIRNLVEDKRHQFLPHELSVLEAASFVIGDYPDVLPRDDLAGFMAAVWAWTEQETPEQRPIVWSRIIYRLLQQDRCGLLLPYIELEDRVMSDALAIVPLEYQRFAEMGYSPAAAAAAQCWPASADWPVSQSWSSAEERALHGAWYSRWGPDMYNPRAHPELIAELDTRQSFVLRLGNVTTAMRDLSQMAPEPYPRLEQDIAVAQISAYRTWGETHFIVTGDRTEAQWAYEQAAALELPAEGHNRREALLHLIVLADAAGF